MDMLDIVFLQGCRRGDEASLAKIVDKYAAYVSTVIHRVIGTRMSREDIEEVASDVFLALWNNADKANARKLKSYLGTIARNKAINKLRKLREDLPFEDDWVMSSTPAPEEELISLEEKKMVRKAVFSMDERDRTIFLLHYYDYRSVAEIADELDTTVEAVKKRLVRGRVKLQKQLYKGGDIDGEENLGFAQQLSRS